MQKAVLALAVLTATVMTHDAGACSCSGAQPAVLSPERVVDAPLNTRVRIELPVTMADTAKLVFRVHGETANIKTTERKMAYGNVNVIELVPAAPLAPSTRYEFGYADPNAHPSTRIIGAFKTGTTSDTTAPKLEKMGAAEAVKPNNQYAGGSCSVSGPWVQIEGLAATDAGRNAQEVSYAIWVADAAGRIDETKTPTVIAKYNWGTLSLGPSSACDPHSFPYPKGGGSMTFGIAAVDLAGNQSAVRRVTVNLASPKTLP